MNAKQAANLRAGDRIITKDGQTILILARGKPFPDSITYYDNGGNQHAFVTDAWVMASTLDPVTTYTFSIEDGVWNAILDGEMIPATFNSKGAAEAGIDVERRRRERAAEQRYIGNLKAGGKGNEK